MRTAGFRTLSMAAALAAASLVATPPSQAEGSAVPNSAQDIRPILIGDEAPGVVLKTTAGADFDLQAAIEKQPTIVVFYRGGW